jgi:two-component system LytT family response regulator
VHAASEAHLVRAAISDVEKKLDPRQFVRIHRGTIVNLSRVRELYRGFGGDFFVILRDDTRLTMSRRYRSRLRHMAGFA